MQLIVVRAAALLLQAGHETKDLHSVEAPLHFQRAQDQYSCRTHHKGTRPYGALLESCRPSGQSDREEQLRVGYKPGLDAELW